MPGKQVSVETSRPGSGDIDLQIIDEKHLICCDV